LKVWSRYASMTDLALVRSSIVRLQYLATPPHTTTLPEQFGQFRKHRILLLNPIGQYPNRTQLTGSSVEEAAGIDIQFVGTEHYQPLLPVNYVGRLYLYPITVTVQTHHISPLCLGYLSQPIFSVLYASPETL
jgi:hypothetical protein